MFQTCFRVWDMIWIHLAIHKILTNKTFTVTDNLISVMKCFGHWQFFFYFSDFILILFCFVFVFLFDDEKTCDTAVTWYVTWCDVIGLEHDGRIWKMMLGYCDNHLSQRQMITQAINLLGQISSGNFTRELNKESLLN